MQHETMEYDVVIVGAGPSGLAAAIKLKQLASPLKQEVKVCVLDKGAQISSHILSGAVLETRSLQALLPDKWQSAPLDTAVSHDAFYYLTSRHAWRLPTPRPMKNHGNYIISLGQLCQFLAAEAEALGCEIYPSIPATEILYHENGAVKGVATGDLGIDRHGQQEASYQPGMHLLAKQTLFAEGCRGELSELLIKRFNLREGVQPQTYALGVKEIWQIAPEKHRLGEVMHTVGWPLKQNVYGGSFLYFFSENRVALGFVVGLDYQNPWLSPFEESQRFKTHPMISKILDNGERIAYGARALNEGGFQSLPKLTFPGGAILGDGAGFLNVAKIKGIHQAIQSGIFAAEAYFEMHSVAATHQSIELTAYSEKFKHSWMAKELYQIRNIRPGFRYGLFFGLVNAAFETYVTQGKTPWTLSNHSDHTTLKLANKSVRIEYPKPDNKLTFDRLSSVYLANTFHEENQLCHLILKDPKVAIEMNYKLYASPETRYCPAAVYEIIEAEGQPKLQINAQNCIHCKTCDIKDPTQNIIWRAPAGGGGPNYVGM